MLAVQNRSAILKFMTIKQVIEFLENMAPKALQENYDNSGLLVGDSQRDLVGILISLDCTEAIVEEAIERQCNLIISHHPIIFSGLKKITSSTDTERAITLAIKNDISLYAIHTNLDNAFYNGVNKWLAHKLGLENVEVLQPIANNLVMLSTYVPEKNAAEVREALFKAGAGNIGEYSQCSFSSLGEGTFRPSENANPSIGKKEELATVKEVKIEVLLRAEQKNQVLQKLREVHPYEEVAYQFVALQNDDVTTGSGAIGRLSKSYSPEKFLQYIKEKLGLAVIKYTSISKDIQTVALCGGSGAFLRHTAALKGADAFISADFKYHDFFDAEGACLYADIGHFESEIHVIEYLHAILSKKYSNFAVLKTKRSTNPVNYYCK